jgi:hypothetical protein
VAADSALPVFRYPGSWASVSPWFYKGGRPRSVLPRRRYFCGRDLRWGLGWQLPAELGQEQMLIGFSAVLDPQAACCSVSCYIAPVDAPSAFTTPIGSFVRAASCR